MVIYLIFLGARCRICLKEAIIIKATFTFEMDGHMAEIIISALQDKARSQECEFETYKHLILAKCLKDAKQAFHNRAYDVMADKYGLPAR